MCGLSGMWQPGGGREEILRARVGAMAAAWCTAAPTTAATTSTRPAGVALGFRRLAIVDLSPTGHQPMRSADGRYVIVFNGEIYNYRELRDRPGRATAPSSAAPPTPR